MRAAINKPKIKFIKSTIDIDEFLNRESDVFRNSPHFRSHLQFTNIATFGEESKHGHLSTIISLDIKLHKSSQYFKKKKRFLHY